MCQTNRIAVTCSVSSDVRNSGTNSELVTNEERSEIIANYRYGNAILGQRDQFSVLKTLSKCDCGESTAIK